MFELFMLIIIYHFPFLEKNSVMMVLFSLFSQEYIIRVQRGVSSENSWQVSEPITTQGRPIRIHLTTLQNQ